MDASGWWHDGWSPVIRSVVVGASAYAALVAIIRVSGKRTLSKMNAFDLVVTVAIGSILASTIVTTSTSLAQGVTGFAVLVGLQTLVAWLSSRSSAIRNIVSSRPALLVYRGVVLDDALRRERVTTAHIAGALRAAGFARVEEVEAVVLESDGSCTAIGRTVAPATTLDGVQAPPM
jgi:uncharacterized membrane protein YcaP (DUF421 family)